MDLVVVGEAFGAANRMLVPFERMGSVVPHLDGSVGLNRASGFCLIAARNDLDAVRAFLHKYRNKAKTARSYRKEVERFLLWCVCREGTAISSVGTDECERYKDFLAAPEDDWIAKGKAQRQSPDWRPFTGPLSPESQRYAVVVLRTFFKWLTAVAYLGGNPWHTVDLPSVDQKEQAMAVDKALPKHLWKSLSEEGGILDRVCARYIDAPLKRALGAGELAAVAAQYRLARAVILLMGSTGMRREEVAAATRNQMKIVRETAGGNQPLWELAVLGKGRKHRTVFFSERVVDALRAHWADRGHDFDDEIGDLAVISAVVVPATYSAKKKHLDKRGELTGSGLAPASIYLLLTTILERIAKDESLPLDAFERELLCRVAPHALRHTWATDAVARKMPLDVVQKLLGHASLSTTTIYARAQRTRSIEEVAKLNCEH